MITMSAIAEAAAAAAAVKRNHNQFQMTKGKAQQKRTNTRYTAAVPVAHWQSHIVQRDEGIGEVLI